MRDSFQRHYRDSLPPIEAGKPGTLLQLAYLSDDGGEVVVVRVFPTAEDLDLQLQGADERSKKTYEFIEPTGIEIYGTPSSSTIERMRKIAGAGIPVSLLPEFTGGFIRPARG
jgi:hypothetical protein